MADAGSDDLDRAIEVFLDATLVLLEGKDDDDLIFLDGFMRSLGEQLGVDMSNIVEIEPMFAAEMRRRYRDAKERLAAGEGPGTHD